MTGDVHTDLPDGWQRCGLNDFAVIVMGQSPSSKTYNHDKKGLPFFQGKKEFGDLYPTINMHCSQPGKIAKPGATLLSVRAPVGPTNLAQHECCIGRGLAALHPSGGIKPKFLLYLFRSIEPTISGKGEGSTFSAITKKIISDLQFNLPPLAEQHRIVAKIEELFSELDKGVENLEKAREQLKVYRQAVLKHAFEGKLTAQWREENKDQLAAPEQLLASIKRDRSTRYERQLKEWRAAGGEGAKPKVPKFLSQLTDEELGGLSELPEGWGWTRFGLLDIELRRGPFGSSITKRMFVPNGFRVYQQGNAIHRDASRGSYFIDEEKYEELSGFAVCPGDFIVSCAGTVGRIYELPDNSDAGVINQALMRVRINDRILSKRFFSRLFESAFFQRKVLSDAKGTAMVNLAGIKQLNLVPVAICGLGEQKAIDELLDAQLAKIHQCEQVTAFSLQHAEALRQSILKRAFSGQLVAQDPKDEPASELLERIKAQKTAQSNGAKLHKKHRRARATA